ncbi:MAG: UDP-N-acetylmuramoyl-tripeptide--D-alanyl-D-alanine ligase [Bacilli bacterium]|nr:UDP-N-acetylmuramoyl-tripeptide--D-alanyl-D-alanine ligase [Bacilli bacterium]MDD4795502.1 UDP-N-acetylmuramoyl-tripeptide--D-alanyl-D-alanine ligase [Bacilli bacterium]
MNWTVQNILEICNGKLYSGDKNIIIGDFSKDTRTIKDGDIYVGIKGENFDGNSFYKDAFSRGASVLILEESYINNLDDTDKTIIIVDDSVLALKKLAMAKLRELKPKVIAVTGSVGKTSTKDMILRVVSQKYKTLATDGNYNNHLGMPLTVLKLKDEEVIILEMGMNNLGEIKYLSDIAEPDIAVITNILPVHIGNLGSMDNILKAKLEIISGLKKDGLLIVNSDNEYLKNINIPSVNLIKCGTKTGEFLAKNITSLSFELNINNKTYIFENKIGTTGFLLNSLLAITVGIKLGISINDIQNAVSNYELTSGRLEKIKTKKGATIINDAYNASTASMINSLEYLQTQTGKRKIAILGNMNELGDDAKKLHEEVGKYISKHPVDFLITIGDNAKYISSEAKLGMNESKIKHFNTKKESKTFLKNLIKPEDIIIVKSSNSNNFIEIVDYLQEAS